MERGEVWWARWPPQQRHPVLLLSWDAHGRTGRDQITVAEVTRTVRGLDAEVELGRRDGMRARCVVNLDRIVTVHRALLESQISTLTAGRMAEVERAIHLALGIAIPCAVGHEL